MPALHSAAVPVEVERVRQRIERWRQARVSGAPIPPALWAAAAKAAQRHGVARTTRALGLDYNKLKLRVQAVAAVAPVDFRCGIDGLAALCRQRLQADPFCGTLFVFRNRKGSAVRVLAYDSQGFWLCHKRLSSGRFRFWPTDARQAGRALEATELQVLLLSQSKPAV